MTNREIIIIINFINKIKESDRAFPIKLSYALNKNFKNFLEIYKTYDEERLKNRENYENKTADEKQKADKELQELLDIKNEDVMVHKVKISDIESCNNLTINEVEFLSEFMVED